MKKDYSDKIFQGKGLRDIVEQIRTIVSSDFSLSQEYDGGLKANTLTSFLQVDEVKGQRILQFISYVDDLLITEKEKVSYIITFSSLLEDGKLNAESLDDGYIFILAEFFRYRTVDEIKKLISLVSVPELVQVVRNKTLDYPVRTEILNYVVNQYQTQGIDSTKQNEFLSQMIINIQGLDYYKLMEMIHS